MSFVDKIEMLAEKRLPLTLSVSLHAPTDRLRNTIMPINKKWGIESLIRASRRYFEQTGRRVSFEYAMIDGVNDGAESAKRLGKLLAGMNCHVNLIPVNRVAGSKYRESGAQRLKAFHEILADMRINATVRRRLGGDVNAACGQLRQLTVDN